MNGAASKKSRETATTQIKEENKTNRKPNMAALSMKRLFLATGLLFLASFVTKAASSEDFYECLPGMPKAGGKYS